MSGHSKWHNIQARKGKQDAKRSNLFTKFAKAITVAAQKGGGDPSMNFSLRLAIEKSKEIGMPKENIERAVKRGTGELNDGTRMEEGLYEAFGPGGVAILVKVVTDNKNRTSSDIKHIVSEHGGNMAGSGSVQWMFDQWGVIIIASSQLDQRNISREEFELQLIENGAEDIKNGEEGQIEIRSKVENFQKTLNFIRDKGIEVSDSGLQWIAKDPMPVTLEIEEKLNNLFGDLEENDDVEDYFTNAE